MSQSGARPIWLYLIALVLALTLPILLVSGYTMWSFATSERAQLEKSVFEVNEQILFALERHLSAETAALRSLSTSPALRESNFRSFKEQAKAVIESNRAFTTMILRDDGGSIVLSAGGELESAIPPELLLPDAEPPALSDASIGKTFEQSAYYITVPVVIAGTDPYYLIARIALPRLAALIREQMIDTGFFATIVDSNGRILARSSESDKHFGKTLNSVTGKIPASFTWRGVNPQGVEVFGVFSRSKLFGWGVGSSISQELLHAPLRRSLMWLAGLVAITLTVGFVIAYFLSRILSGAATRIVSAALDLGEGRDVPAITTPVKEANIVGNALRDASEKLRQHSEALSAVNKTLELKVSERTAELAAKTTLLETTLSNMDQGLVVVGADDRIRLFNDTASSFINVPADFLRLQPTVADMIGYCRAAGYFDSLPADVEIMVDRAKLVPGQTVVNERERPDGKVIEVRTVPLADGSLVRTYTDVTLRKHAERHLHHIARHDELTSLPNRVLFRERLEQAIAFHKRHGAPFSVLFMDLDHFKQVNDSFGHDVGDALLKEVAGRFKSALRMEDTVARFGGDEFAVLQTGSGALGDPIRLARRLIDNLAGTYRIGDVDVKSGLSIGVARCPEHGLDADTLLKKADVALYQAKRLGRGRFFFATNDDRPLMAG